MPRLYRDAYIHTADEARHLRSALREKYRFKSCGPPHVLQTCVVGCNAYKFSAGNTSIIVPVAQILTETRTVACAAMEAAVAILSFAIDKLKRRRAA